MGDRKFSWGTGSLHGGHKIFRACGPGLTRTMGEVGSGAERWKEGQRGGKWRRELGGGAERWKLS